MPAANLDRIDLLLLAELQRAGRQTNAELAERVNLSASACLRRVQRLERDGVIANTVNTPNTRIRVRRMSAVGRGLCMGNP